VIVTAFHSYQKDFEQIFVIQGELSVLPSIHVGCAVKSKGNSQLCELQDVSMAHCDGLKVIAILMEPQKGYTKLLFPLGIG